MTAGFGVVARDEVALDPGDGHLERLLDLRTTRRPIRARISPIRPGSVSGKSRRRFQPSSKCSTDRPSASCMKPLSLPLPRSKQSTRWRQSSGSRTSASVRIGAGAQSPKAGSAAPPDRAARRPGRARPTARRRRPQHPVEDDPGSGSSEGAGQALVVPQKPDRWKSRLERVPRSRARFGDDSEEGGFAALDQAPMGGHRLQRGVRLRIVGRDRGRRAR